MLFSGNMALVVPSSVATSRPPVLAILVWARDPSMRKTECAEIGVFHDATEFDSHRHRRHLVLHVLWLRDGWEGEHSFPAVQLKCCCAYVHVYIAGPKMGVGAVDGLLAPFASSEKPCNLDDG